MKQSWSVLTYPSHAMTPWSLWFIDITGRRRSSLVIFYQACPAAFSSCLFWDLVTLSFPSAYETSVQLDSDEVNEMDSQSFSLPCCRNQELSKEFEGICLNSKMLLYYGCAESPVCVFVSICWGSKISFIFIQIKVEITSGIWWLLLLSGHTFSMDSPSRNQTPNIRSLWQTTYNGYCWSQRHLVYTLSNWSAFYSLHVRR